MPLIASTQTSLRARRLRERTVVMFISLTSCIGSFHHRDGRRLPCGVDDRRLGPIGTYVERERAIRGGQPVAFLVLAGRLGTSVERQRTVRVVFEILVLGPQRIALQ